MDNPALGRDQYLAFTISGETYAVAIVQVTEIIKYDPRITTVPAMPPWVRGVINLRGGVVPVVDLALKFGLSSGPITKRTCVVIVETLLGEERSAVGIIADSVNEVLELSTRDLEPPPPFGARIRADFLKGLAREGSRFLLVLDLDRALGAPALQTGGVRGAEAQGSQRP